MDNPKNAATHKKTLKRFYKDVNVGQAEGGWQVLLDGKPIRTPAKALLVLPTQRLAEAVAGEWARQGEEVALDAMHLMQFSCAALDYTQGFRTDVESETLAYISTDLLCYRAQEPQELTQRQNVGWNRWIDWAEKRYGIRMVLVMGIMPVAQADATTEVMEQELKRLDDFMLTALWLAARQTSSLLLALAVAERQIAASEAFILSRIDETYQNEQWGEDEEARRRRETGAAEMAALGEFIALLQ